MNIQWAMVLLFMLGCSVASAQASRCPKIPDSYHWVSARDYKREEELVIKTLQWLIKTPIHHEIEIRGKANLFVMEWICGSPRIDLVIHSDRLPFYVDYPELLFPYLHGMALCKLVKNEECNELQGMIEGFNIVAFMVLNDTDFKKVKSLQPITKAYKKGKMRAYVESLISNQP